MNGPPLNPDKSTAGIVVDPRTLERVVPSSRRKDGTTRKELKIRPGFTPQEDVGRFRGTRQSASDSTKGYIPGSNRPPAPKPSNPDNPFAQDPITKSKSALKNEKRRAASKRTVAAGTSKAWDEDDSENENDFVTSEDAFPPLGGGGGAPIPSSISPTPKDPTAHVTPVESLLEVPPPSSTPPSSEPPVTSASSSKPDNAISADTTASKTAWKKNPIDASPSSSSTTTKTQSTDTRPPNTRNASSGTRGKSHPIQGGRQGPIGLAHPPPPNTSKAQKSPSQPAKQEPRVRKEVKVREGGANDLASLSSRLRGMVIANANQETPRQRKERAAAGGANAPATAEEGA